MLHTLHENDVFQGCISQENDVSLLYFGWTTTQWNEQEQVGQQCPSLDISCKVNKVN